MTAASAEIPADNSAIRRPFLAITAADLIVRSAYQMGKTPLLPIFAASLGATDIYLGFIVSVSTLTGMVLKPIIGLLSDRAGRRLWLFAGTALFIVVPFFYWLVHSPGELLAIRLVHGLATAIYGPVSVAYVVELSGQRRGERVGWFGMARSAGYVIGPALGGALLLFLAPQQVFPIIGGLSLLALAPTLILGETQRRAPESRASWGAELRQMVAATTRSTAIWLSGGLEALMFIALYAAKAFLPIYGLTLGLNAAQVGLYFALQEGVTIVMRPACGRLGDRVGYLAAVSGGMFLLAGAFLLLGQAGGLPLLLLPAVLAGAGQALIAPNIVGMLASQLRGDYLAAGLGAVGSLQNGSKVMGPLLAGLLIRWFDYTGMFQLIGGLLLAGALGLGGRVLYQRLRKQPVWEMRGG